MFHSQNYLSTTLDFSTDVAPLKSSKQRRELINQEINNIRTLLPLKNKSLQRLSQLEVMSMACIYIRKCHFLGSSFSSEDLEGTNEFLNALPGFFLVCTLDGKLVYISNNVTDFLGHSMIDITKQGDNIYDIIDPKDHNVIHSELTNWSDKEVNFYCRIALSRYTRRQSSFFDEKVIQVSGYFRYPAMTSSLQGPVLLAMCTPVLSPAIKASVLSRTSTSYVSVHNLDMTFVEASYLCEYYLGYSENKLIGQSWYNFVAANTLQVASSNHIEVIEVGSNGCSVFHGEFLNAQGDSFPVAVCLKLHKTDEESEHIIICTVQILKAPTPSSLTGDCLEKDYFWQCARDDVISPSDSTQSHIKFNEPAGSIQKSSQKNTLNNVVSHHSPIIPSFTTSGKSARLQQASQPISAFDMYDQAATFIPHLPKSLDVQKDDNLLKYTDLAAIPAIPAKLNQNLLQFNNKAFLSERLLSQLNDTSFDKLGYYYSAAAGAGPEPSPMSFPDKHTLSPVWLSL